MFCQFDIWRIQETLFSFSSQMIKCEESDMSIVPKKLVDSRLAGIEGLIWKDLRATFGTRLAEAGCDAFTIAQLLGHSDVRVTMRYVRMVEGSKRVAVEAMKLTFGKVGHVLATWPKQPQLPVAVNG